MQEIEISKGIKRIQFDSFDSWLNARHGIGGLQATGGIQDKSPQKELSFSRIHFVKRQLFLS